jgi:hypothetical protein
MANNKVGILLIVIAGLIVALTIQSIRLQHAITPVIIDSTDAKIAAIDELLRKELVVKDSLISSLSAKRTIIQNNTIIYEVQNKGIANLDSTATDSLFKQNLQSDYKRFGWMLNTQR